MIDFNAERWARVKETSRRWWAGELDRPLFHLTLGGFPPARPPATLSRVAKDLTAYDLAVTPDAIVDRWDYELAGCRWVGDGFPHVWVDFGPGVIAAFLGATPVPGHGTVWFQPRQQQEIAEIELRHQPGNVWLERIQAICRAALDRWGGQVQVGMTDLGGNLDIVSSFRPAERLLYDLLDFPADVERLTWDGHHLWWRYFDEINAVLQPRNPGYTAWTGIYSAEPYYMLQCDFCYMIGPAMFDEFVRPELAASCARLRNAFYHLDGPGQLPHLDSLLSIPELKGVQWVPGAGQPGEAHWPDVYRRIRRAGKLIQLFNPAALDAVVQATGDAAGIVVLGSAPAARAGEFQSLLRRYGAE